MNYFASLTQELGKGFNNQPILPLNYKNKKNIHRRRRSHEIKSSNQVVDSSNNANNSRYSCSNAASVSTPPLPTLTQT